MARSADPELAARRRREILDAALTCFSTRGFHQSSMQEICTEAGISAGALYRYFPSKSDLIAAIAEDQRRLAAETLENADPKLSLVDRLVQAVRLRLDRLQGAHASGMIAEVIAESARDPDLADRLAAIDTAARVRFAKSIAAAQSRGEIDPTIIPDRAAETLFAAFDGLALRMAVLRRWSDEHVLDDFRDLAERYLAPVPPPVSKRPALVSAKDE